MGSNRAQKLDPYRFLVWALLEESRAFPLVHHIFEIDFTGVDKFRAGYEEETGRRPSYVACTLFAISRVLKQHPKFNSYLRTFPTTRLTTYDDVDIVFTVERWEDGKPFVFLDRIREADKKGLNAFIERLQEASRRSVAEYRRRMMTDYVLRIPRFLRRPLYKIFIAAYPERMKLIFGTTSFTSAGKFGTTIIIARAPRTATFTLGLIRKRPIVRDDKVVAANTGYVTISYDHRVADGAEVARLGNELRFFIEHFEA